MKTLYKLFIEESEEESFLAVMQKQSNRIKEQQEELAAYEQRVLEQIRTIREKDMQLAVQQNRIEELEQKEKTHDTRPPIF